MNKIIRKGSFDAGHRVMFQRFKCSHMHGHRYEYQLEFSYKEMQDLGYAIDFSEIKRIGCAWIDSQMDHSFLANPLDAKVIALAQELGSNIFTMHLTDAKGSCNPTVENIAKEIYFATHTLLNSENLKLERVVLHETANCIGICEGLSPAEFEVFRSHKGYVQQLTEFRAQAGNIEYDSRKL